MTRSGWHVLTVTVAVLALALYGQEQRRRGAAEAQGARWKAELDSLAVVARARDTVYVRDTVRLWRTIATYDTVRSRDTLVRNDTVFIPRIVADNAVAECKATIFTCEQRVADRDNQLNAWQQRWDTREKPPSAFRKWTERILWGVAGYGAGKVAP